jgi:hypothetical protein
MEWTQVRTLEGVKQFSEWFQAQDTRTKNRIRADMGKILSLEYEKFHANRQKERASAEKPIYKTKTRRPRRRS